MKLTESELKNRWIKFSSLMNERYPDWDSAVIFSKVNQYYFVGTMQDALLIFKKGRLEPGYYVRRSYDRAIMEMPVADIAHEMMKYSDILEYEGDCLGNMYTELEIVPVATLKRFKKRFKVTTVSSIDYDIMDLRSVKSEYEIHWQKKACEEHHNLLINTVPALMKEGMSEAEFVGKIFESMVSHGYQGITRFFRFGTELIAGQIAFGTNSLLPTSFDGPGGAMGNSPASPVTGSRTRKLKKGDIVFVDCGFGMEGYNSDKTQVYAFGFKPDNMIFDIHKRCMEIQSITAEKMVPGAIPSEIYSEVMATLSDEFLENFMGYKDRQVKFLGHGVGLQIDEMPVIAKGFNAPLVENMTIALEPKKGIEGVGMVGVEDTYLVTKTGGVCMTGKPMEIIVVE